MSTYEQLSYHDQLKLFQERGIKFEYGFDDNFPNNLRIISTIGYYQLKDYANPYFRDGKYINLGFSALIARYYRDKRLRNSVEHAIEDIEVTLNTRIAFILGEKYGSFGYLCFRQWVQLSGKNKYLNYRKVDKYFIASEQNRFLQKIQNKAKRSSSKDVQKFDRIHADSVYIPIWLMMNELTLGDSIHMVKLMSDENRKLLAKEFDCTVDELISWLECINLVRNICCHNGNLADISLRTKPIIPLEFKNYLYVYADKGCESTYTNKLALVVCIVVKLMNSINPKYKFGNVINSISHLIDDTTTANYYGFVSQNALIECFN